MPLLPSEPEWRCTLPFHLVPFCLSPRSSRDPLIHLPCCPRLPLPSFLSPSPTFSLPLFYFSATFSSPFYFVLTLTLLPYITHPYTKRSSIPFPNHPLPLSSFFLLLPCSPFYFCPTFSSPFYFDSLHTVLPYFTHPYTKLSSIPLHNLPLPFPSSSLSLPCSPIPLYALHGINKRLIVNRYSSLLLQHWFSQIV